ncbi:MAG: hypothetical protein HYZ13_04220 [Acidobacteria bacterium]|nr:hypothetical protein [Acidobacteriota bacterium]
MSKTIALGLAVSILACGRSKTSQAIPTPAVQNLSLEESLDTAKVSAVSRWGDRLCVARRTDDGYSVSVYRKDASKRLANIYEGRFDGVYQMDGSASDAFLIIYGSSAVATQMSLLRWNYETQKVEEFKDDRFDGDSRMRPEVLGTPKGFRILTFGNLHDMGNEPDESKWYAIIHTFQEGHMVSTKKVPYLKRFDLLKP